MNSNIRLETYDIFKEIYENGSLTKASEKLRIAQPSISYRIKMLESSLGVKLFNRTQKGMEPTYIADELYSNIKDALDVIKCAEKNIIEENTCGTGDIYIGVQQHIGKYFLTSIIKEYISMYPNVKIHIINKGTATLVDLLERGKLDFIVDTLPISSSKVPLKIEEIDKLHTCFAKMPNSPQKYILPMIGSTMRTQIEEFLQEKGIIINPDFEVYTTEMMIEMVKQKIGIAYTIQEFIESELGHEIEYEKIAENLPTLTCCIAYINKKQSFLINKFIELIKKGKI